MLEEFTPSPEELREILRAEVLLADLDLYEELANDVDQETCPNLRESFRGTYRDLMGIDPSQRSLLRKGLNGIARTGRYAIADLLADLGASSTEKESRARATSSRSDQRRNRPW